MSDTKTTPVGSVIRQAREAVGISQGDLANMIGTDQTTLSRWELGNAGPNALDRWGSMLRLIERSLNLPYGYLLREAGLVDTEIGTVSPRAAIMGDEQLPPKHRRALVLMYEGMLALAGTDDD